MHEWPGEWWNEEFLLIFSKDGRRTQLKLDVVVSASFFIIILGEWEAQWLSNELNGLATPFPPSLGTPHHRDTILLSYIPLELNVQHIELDLIHDQLTKYIPDHLHCKLKHCCCSVLTYAHHHLPFTSFLQLLNGQIIVQRWLRLNHFFNFGWCHSLFEFLFLCNITKLQLLQWLLPLVQPLLANAAQLHIQLHLQCLYGLSYQPPLLQSPRLQWD